MNPRQAFAVFSALSFALWLALRAPGLDFAERAWVPIAGWVVLGLLALSPMGATRRLGAGSDTYGILAATWGGLVAGLGALLSAGALLVARYATQPGSPWRDWATSPVLGAFLVLALLAVLVPQMAMKDESLGEEGTRPLEERREGIRSHPAPERSADGWRGPGPSGS